MSSKPEPAIWSHVTGQQIPCFDRCQLTITWMIYAVNQGCYNLWRHITRIPIFLHSPSQKFLLKQIKRLFPPSPIAMLFAVTQEMHAWAAKLKQHCTRGGEGGEFVSLGHDGTMARNWKLYWNVSTVLSGVVPCGWICNYKQSYMQNCESNINKSVHNIQTKHSCMQKYKMR